jgi:deoxyribodipyrimidine photo-lyase
LVDLDRSLERLGGGLVMREGDPAREIPRLASEAGCREVWFTHDSSRYAAARAEHLVEAGLVTRVFPGHAVVEPGDVSPAGRDHYRVFTPYFRAWSQAPRRPVKDAPGRVVLPRDIDRGPRPDPGSVVPDSPERAAGGETEARSRLDLFAQEGGRTYGDKRNEVYLDGTSRLSPYLRFGCVSANEVASALGGSPEFVRQLAWRDFFLQMLAADPAIATRDIRPAIEPWRVDPEGLEAWKRGRTGLPLVDAGMRQLAREGWMHGRVRMVVGSLLTRRMEIDWREGKRHFDRLLVDGDVANNSGNWQWIAGTGSDPRRGRVLNPVRQARRFDPAGEYVRRYVEELADVPAPAIFAPWRDPDLLRRTGYPRPLVDVVDR